MICVQFSSGLRQLAVCVGERLFVILLRTSGLMAEIGSSTARWHSHSGLTQMTYCLGNPLIEIGPDGVVV